jgi:pimeloyl-ACP methyl ester carboxylesterase
MSSFVLVHGAWHGGWCWDRVVPLLEQHGHKASAPTLAGVGDRASELRPGIGLSDHVHDLVTMLERESEPVTLVGHSYAGLVVREAALRVPDTIREVVLVEGWIGPGGASLLELAPDWFAEGIRRAAAEQGDGWRVPVPDPAVVGVIDPADARWLRARLTEQPFKSFTDPTTPGDGPSPPTRAIVATPGPVPFADMAASLGVPVWRIKGGHDLMITSPNALTDALLEAE